MRSVLPILLCAVALGCAAEDGVSYDPFAGLDGKADGGRSFFEEAWTLELETDRDRLTVTGDDGRARYRDVERARWSTDAERLRLASGDRLAGMRSFLVADGELDERLRVARVLAAAGLATPRAVRVRWIVDGVDLGERVLVEHVGDRFLRDRFDDDTGRLYRAAADEGADLLPLALALGADAHEVLGARAVSETFEVGALGAAIAAGEALGPVELAFYETDDGFAAVPELAAEVVDAGALRGALRHPEVRAAWGAALVRLAACLESARCGDDPDRAAALAALAAREREADAPGGYAFYPGVTVPEEGRLELAFRNLDPATHAAEVWLETGTRSLAATHDESRDLWVVELDVDVDVAIDVAWRVIGDDGVEHRLADPTGHDRVDPATLDVLEEVDRFGLPVGEPSGLAAWGERLFVVGDEGDDVFEIDPATGEVLDRIDVGARGLEGVAIDPWREELIVADEDSGRILRFDLEGHELDAVHLGWAEDGNGGVEGLTVRPSDGHVLLAKERDPVRIGELDLHGELVRRRTLDDGPSDLSALAIDPTDGRLYALSDQDRALLRLNDDWEVEASWDLDVEKPEGLVVRGGVVYVVSDARHELVTYRLGR